MQRFAFMAALVIGLAHSEYAFAQRQVQSIGSWEVIVDPPMAGRSYGVCQAEPREKPSGWTLALSRFRGEFSVTIRHQRLRPTSRINEILTGSVGGQRVRFQVERPLMNLDGPGGGLVLTIVDDEAFRRGLRSGAQIQIATPQGQLRWPASGGSDALDAMSRCTW